MSGDDARLPRAVFWSAAAPGEFTSSLRIAVLFSSSVKIGSTCLFYAIIVPFQSPKDGRKTLRSHLDAAGGS